MKKIILMSVFLALVLGACQKVTPSIPASETPDMIGTMVATLAGGATPTVSEGTPVPTPDTASEHLAKLKEGMEAWNTWRTQHPGIKPNLRRVDLQGADLTSYNLFKAILANTNLSGAILVSANLKAANLQSAKLDNANLTKALLNNANLVGAILTNAVLTDAILTNARYDNTTVWPIGFDPVAAGAKLVTP